MKRQVVLDTETTGLSPKNGDRIIEIGCVEVINRKLTGKVYHQYINPDKEISSGAYDVHGISNQFLEDKPRFAQIASSLKDFLEDSELVIHNAPFDVGFIEFEFSLIDDPWENLDQYCGILDTLKMARERHPGQKNNLDALCRRYFIDNSHREKHGALLDAEILAELYLMMTGGQTTMSLEVQTKKTNKVKDWELSGVELPVLRASTHELNAHHEYLKAIETSSGQCLWRSLESRDE